MATYVMSDLHGDWAHFRFMLLKIHFSEKDHLYIIGDVVDRGPRGIQLLRYTRQQKNITLLMGNHELMVLEGIMHSQNELDKDWFDPQTLKELNELTVRERLEVVQYIQNLPLTLTVEVKGKSYELVHASPAPMGVYGSKALEYFLWTRVSPEEHFNKCVIAGHTPTAYYQDCVPLRIWHHNNYTNIDCGTAFRSVLPGGCLGCMRLEDSKEFYI